MTAPTAYTTLDSDDLGANKILRAATMSALDSNPVAIAQRGTGAPWLNGIGAITSITSGSGNWTVPTGVYRIKVQCTGGGQGGGGGTGGEAGSNSAFGSITGYGGLFGGGTAAGGDINFKGSPGSSDAGGDSRNGRGGSLGGSSNPPQYGGGGYPYGGGGGTALKIMSVEPGDVIAYSVGNGGSVGPGGDSMGASGIIIIEY